MRKKNNKQKKSYQELHKYKNMVKNKTGFEDTDDCKIYTKDLQGTNEIIDEDRYLTENKENEEIQKPPLIYRTKEFFESHFTGTLTTIIIGIAGWSVGLQIGQAVQSNKIQTIEENQKETRITIEDKYIRKDIYEIQLENLKDKIKDMEEEIKEMKMKN